LNFFILPTQGHVHAYIARLRRTDRKRCRFRVHPEESFSFKTIWRLYLLGSRSKSLGPSQSTAYSLYPNSSKSSVSDACTLATKQERHPKNIKPPSRPPTQDELNLEMGKRHGQAHRVLPKTRCRPGLVINAATGMAHVPESMVLLAKKTFFGIGAN
jgi:hypothetical protein